MHRTNGEVCRAFASKDSVVAISDNMRYYPGEKGFTMDSLAELYSYSETIACWIGGKAYIRNLKVSATTSMHIAQARLALIAAREPYTELPDKAYLDFYRAVWTSLRAIQPIYEKGTK